MKLLTFLLFTTLLITGCQSTPTTSVRQSSSRTQQIESVINTLQAEISAGNENKKYELALIYVASFDQNKRFLAKALLEDLAKQQHIDALILLAQLEFTGRMGIVSDRLFAENYQVIQAKDPSVITNYEREKSEMVNALENHFSALKSNYDSSFQLCEQPLKNATPQLEPNAAAYLYVKYLNTCLETYSLKNSQQRLQAMAKFQTIVCSTKDNDKVCIGEGYQALSAGYKMAKPSFVVAAALRNIYKTHKSLLQKEQATQKRYPSNAVSDVVIKAFDAYNKQQINESCQILQTYLENTPKLTAFDTAYIQKTLANLLIVREQHEDLATAIHYLSSAFKSNEFSGEEQLQLFDTLSDAYFRNAEYSKYVSLIGDYIVENQGTMDLLPVFDRVEAHHSTESNQLK